MSSHKQRVIYLVGAPRSGTTLLTSLLGEVSGVFAAAETRMLWRHLEARRCGCGSQARECPIWSQVLNHVQRVTGANPADVVKLQRSATELRHLTSTMRRANRPRGALREYAGVLRAL